MVIHTVVAPTVKGNDSYIRFPHWLPREYKQEINDWLHVIRQDDSWARRCQDLLSHGLMCDFWKIWRAKANSSVQIGGNLDTELPKHFKTAIMLMVYRGGPLPKEPLIKKLGRRKEIADIIRALRALAREDDRLLDFPASTLVEIAQPQGKHSWLQMSQDERDTYQDNQTDEDLARLYAEESENTRQRRALLETTRGITFGMMLDALHSRLKNGNPLDSFDAVKDDWYSPKGSKKDRQRLYLELQLEDLFMLIGDDAAQRNLTAMALTIATGEQVTATEVGNRQRQRARKHNHS